MMEFLHMLEKMKCNTRHSWTSNGRQESVADHSWRLAVMALLLRESFPGADMDRVIRMCLIHDWGEAVTGDIPAFQKNDGHRAVEARAVEGLLSRLPETERGELTALFAEMEALESREARIYKALDRLEAVIQHNEAPLESWLPLERELNRTYGVGECSREPLLRELRDLALEETEEKLEGTD
ncbi:HD family hydrolase [Pseudoflavonifractor sp. MSJ-37]|uniref:HD domain-containing protein n=1 Tax=Pseudoflavonifractor sp. MSJ-37 TaxID=2841531 RepID=UPI0020A041E6|nr:HD domain-containing protein [Pseudoflavonifractor sp. MSJ-37]